MHFIDIPSCELDELYRLSSSKIRKGEIFLPAKTNGFDLGQAQTLSEESSGTEVQQLQQMLNVAGYGLIAEDGVWGAETERAVSKYLEYYNSTEFQESLRPIDNVPPKELCMDSQGEYVGQLQRMLNDAGYGTIAVDKIWGMETESSVAKYLRDYNSINILYIC